MLTICLLVRQRLNPCKRDLGASGPLTAASSVIDVTVLPRTEWWQHVPLKDRARENRNGRMWTLFMAPRTPSPRLITGTVNTSTSITAHGSCIHGAQGRFPWALFKIPCKHIDWNCQHVLSIREKEIAQYYCCHRWASQLIIECNITAGVCIFLVDIFHIISVAKLIYLNLSSADANPSQTCGNVFFDLNKPRNKVLWWNEHAVAVFYSSNNSSKKTRQVIDCTCSSQGFQQQNDFNAHFVRHPLPARPS